ncbi:hypothetical protein F5Y06DRAFT_305841 [Hypoxylon sp. FL0890]|nr:hypothetical protein F5Y06DRAFT_305841 [Hypoxylon sp. FL0890]
MSGIISTLARASCQHGSRLAVAASACQRRSTSWIAWEQPNPSLYAPPPQAPVSNETQEASSKTQNTRSVGKAVTAPATTAVAGGSQEVSTSGKTVPSSIQAGTSRIHFSQTRSAHSKSKSEDHASLPTTLLRIPGESSTWPVETPEFPDQPRIRKTRTVHENEGPVRKEETPAPASESEEAEPKDTKDRSILRVLSNIAFGLKALEQNPYSPHPVISFDKAIKKYMEGVQTRHEALARAKELHAARQAADEKDREEWRRVVKKALDTSIDKGQGEREGEGGKNASTG